MRKALLLVDDPRLTRSIAMPLRLAFKDLKLILTNTCGEAKDVLLTEGPDLLIMDTRITDEDEDALLELMKLHKDGVKIIFTGFQLTMIQGAEKGEDVVKVMESHFDSHFLVEEVGRFLDIPYHLPVVDDLLECSVVEHDEVAYPSHVHELASHLTGLIALIRSTAEEMKEKLREGALCEDGIEDWNDELVAEVRRMWENNRT